MTGRSIVRSSNLSAGEFEIIELTEYTRNE